MVILFYFLGASTAGPTANWICYRYTLVLAAAIFFVGSILMAFAADYAFLMVGHFVGGIGVGYALTVSPVFTTEISPDSSRGFLTSLPEVVFNVVFSIGIGPIAWVYSSEVFPMRLRAQGCSMAAAVNIFTGGIVLLSFQLLLLFNRIDLGGVFFLHTGIAIVRWIFFYLFLPETKGTSIEEMETLFDGLWKFCKYRIGKFCEW
ncbi:hypothetical protein ACH5RR_007346 [Cinchona calisaya]|uniref:Major facilitator superfamily (MFS) profile domain-containing protein n=1 Tax=Cinchona calisaya TaxID=153742 RepID=A0ABD3ARN4_9GENT